MKKIVSIGLLLFALAFAGQFQKIYSVENLEQASQEDLNTYLDKATKLKKDGKTVTIVGGALLGADVLFAIINNADTYSMVADLGLTAIASLGTIATGISMNVTGKKRIERINTIKNTTFDGIKIDLKPTVQYNLATQNYQPAATLRIRF